MATKTITLSKSESCVAILTYDDLALTASSVTLANISGTNSITYWLTSLGVTQFRTVIPGATSILTFTLPLAITIGVNGPIITNLNNYGMGMGVDTSGF